MSYDIAHRWNLKRTVQMNLFIKQKWSHRHRKQTYGYRGEGGGINRRLASTHAHSVCIAQ